MARRAPEATDPSPQLLRAFWGLKGRGLLGAPYAGGSIAAASSCPSRHTLGWSPAAAAAAAGSTASRPPACLWPGPAPPFPSRARTGSPPATSGRAPSPAHAPANGRERPALGPTAWCGRERAESGRGRGPEAPVVAADESKKGRRRGKGEPASLHRQEVRLAAGPFSASSQAPAERRSKVAAGGAAPRQLKSSAHAQTRLASEADRPAPQTRPRLQHPAADRTA
ncbi:hypothetical protein R6Z07F_000264 [Ovis aries]